MTANAETPPAAGLYDRLFREGHRFDFYQAVRLLEHFDPAAPPLGTTSSARRERVRVRPDHARTFPATDVRGVDPPTPSSPARITVTFLGLYGIDAPLPPALFEPVTMEQPGAEALRAFLDIFNHRLYVYFYRAWCKYRPELEHRSDDAHARRFAAVAGLPGAEAALPASALHLASFAGVLAPHVRHPEGLCHLVHDLLGGAPVRLRENVGRWVALVRRPRLGSTPPVGLGESAVLGARVYDETGLFRLVIGPVGIEAYLDLLPGGARARTLARLLRLYLSDALDAEVELQLEAGDVPRARLGDPAVRLGLTACLGTRASVPLTHVVRYAAAA